MTSINQRACNACCASTSRFRPLSWIGYWNVLMTNEAAPLCSIASSTWRHGRRPRNLLHLMFDPEGMRPFIANWPQTARGLFARVHREAVGHVIDQKTKALLAELSQYPGVKAEWRAPSPGSMRADDPASASSRTA